MKLSFWEADTNTKRRGLQKEKNEERERGDFPFWNRFGFWGLIYIREKGC